MTAFSNYFILAISIPVNYYLIGMIVKIAIDLSDKSSSISYIKTSKSFFSFILHLQWNHAIQYD